MHLVCIFGPPAVGKMTVGRELSRQTGSKLLHNHMTIEPVLDKCDRTARAPLAARRERHGIA